MQADNIQAPRLAEYDACTGCGSCLAICKRKAISMIRDNEGFLRPVINASSCIGCHMCEMACPVLTKIVGVVGSKAYAVVSNDSEVRSRSTSGGVFPLVANLMLKEGGIVYGVAFDGDTRQVVFKSVMNSHDIGPICGSKYVQAYPHAAYLEISKRLAESRVPILFAGTPCQVAGLKNFLSISGVPQDNLYLVEVICHGVPSRLAFERFMEQFKFRISTVVFRSKIKGWYDYKMEVNDIEGKNRLRSQRVPAYLMGFLKSLYNRRSCQECKFRNGITLADLTIGDCWGIEKKYPDMFDNKGASLVITRTGKGRELLLRITDSVDCREYDWGIAISDNPSLVRSPRQHPSREEFFKRMCGRAHFDREVKKLLKITFGWRVQRFITSRAVRFGKYIANKLGMNSLI